MKVLVPVKHVIDYNVQIQIKNGKVVKPRQTFNNPFDEIMEMPTIEKQNMKSIALVLRR